MGQTSRMRNSGLQAERAVLAWNRTSHAVFVNALLSLRSGWANKGAALTTLALLLLIAAGAITCYGLYRRQHLYSASGTSAPPAIAIAMTALVTLLACAAGLKSIVFP